MKHIPFSVIIPTRNRAEQLRDVLLRIAQLDYPRDKFEVIVVNNRSTDSTNRVVDTFRRAHSSLTISLISEYQPGPSFARNAGIRKAKYSHIACIDDDILVDKEYLQKLNIAFQKHTNATIIGGKVIESSKKNINVQKNYPEMGWIFAVTQRHNRGDYILKYPDALFSANMSINLKKLNTRKVFDTRLGRTIGNTTLLGEDTELCFRLMLEHHTIVYDPLIVTEHIISNSRTKAKYIIKRFLLSGLENKHIDTIHSFLYRQHKDYVPNILRVLILLKRSTMGPPLPNAFLRLVGEIFLIIGYYLPERITLLLAQSVFS